MHNGIQTLLQLSKVGEVGAEAIAGGAIVVLLKEIHWCHRGLHPIYQNQVGETRTGAWITLT